MTIGSVTFALFWLMLATNKNESSSDPLFTITMTTDNTHTLSGKKRKAETVASDASPKKAKTTKHLVSQLPTPTKRKLQNPEEGNSKKKMKTSDAGPAFTPAPEFTPASGSDSVASPVTAPGPNPVTTSAPGTAPGTVCAPGTAVSTPVPGPTPDAASAPGTTSELGTAESAPAPGPGPAPTSGPTPATGTAPAPVPRLLPVLLLLLLATLGSAIIIFLMNPPAGDVLLCETNQYMNDNGQCAECPFLYTCDGKESKSSIISAMDMMDVSKWDVPSAINTQFIISNLKLLEVDAFKWSPPNANNIQSMFSSTKFPSSWRSSSSSWSPSSSHA